jgi:hypothetical protein
MRRRLLALPLALLTLIALTCSARGDNPEKHMQRHYTDSALLGVPGPAQEAAPETRSTGNHVPSVPPAWGRGAPDVSAEHWTDPGPREAIELGLVPVADDGRFHGSRMVSQQALVSAMRAVLAKGASAHRGSLRLPMLPLLSAEAPLEVSAGQLATRGDLARAVAAALCNFEPTAAALGKAMGGATEIFDDVPEGVPAFRTIVAVRDLDVTRGWRDGGFHAGATFTRHELAEVAARTWWMIDAACG